MKLSSLVLSALMTVVAVGADGDLTSSAKAGCKSGERAGFKDVEEFPNYAACSSSTDLEGIDVSSDNEELNSICAPGWRICTGYDVFNHGVTYTDAVNANDIDGCYAYNSAQDCNGCFKTCGDTQSVNGANGCFDHTGGHDIAGVGSTCKKRGANRDSCFGKGRIDLKWGSNDCALPSSEIIDGIVCCRPTKEPLGKCTDNTASWSGDPHFKTFGGLRYDCQGEGEFVIAKSESGLMIQGRFMPGFTTRHVTATRSVVFTSDSTDSSVPTIQVSVPESQDGENGACPYTYSVDGELWDIELKGDGRSDVVQVMKGNGRAMTFIFPDTTRIDVTVKYSEKNGCQLAVRTCIPDDHTNVIGMLGSTDENRNNWITSTNVDYDVYPETREQRLGSAAFDYCVDEWCIRSKANSMFTYYNDKTFEDYAGDCLSKTPPDETVTPLAAFDVELVQLCEEEVMDEDMDACLIEGDVGGVEDAVKLAECENEFEALDDTPLTVILCDEADLIETPPGFNPGDLTDESGDLNIDPEMTPPPPDGGGFGDPHFLTWSGDRYEYHGVCDLVLLSNPNFAKSAGMSIHLRTKKTKQWSYISTAVLKMGDETLEVHADNSKKIDETYFINGVQGGTENNSILGFPVTIRDNTSVQREFVVSLSGNEEEDVIMIKTFRDMVRVDIHRASETNFANSLGLMGSFDLNGEKVGRDNEVTFDDINSYGQEWQVLPGSDNMHFHATEGPQAPEKCKLPSASSSRRRLSEASVSQEDAEFACGRVSPQDFDTCVFDVMAMSDIDVAGAY